MSNAAKAHMQRVAELGCVICRRVTNQGWTPAEVHHAFDTARRSDWLTVPLCPEHHRGGTGFHGMGERAFNRLYQTDETELIGWTVEDLAKSRRAA